MNWFMITNLDHEEGEGAVEGYGSAPAIARCRGAGSSPEPVVVGACVPGGARCAGTVRGGAAAQVSPGRCFSAKGCCATWKHA